jgi:hypothetical protein
MNVVQGDNGVISVKVDDVYLPVGCFESFAYTFKNEIIAKTDVNAGLFRKKRARISDGSLSVSGAMTLTSVGSVSPFYFLQEGIRRSELDIKLSWTDDGGVSRYLSGLFIVESCELSNTVGDIDSFDIEFQGTGELTVSEEESPSEIVCYNSDSDWWQPSAAATSFSGAGHLGKSFAGKTVLVVIREAGRPLVYTSATPGDGEYSYDGTTIRIWASSPFDGAERVFVLWQTVS